jgi:hypothetical protein
MTRFGGEETMLNSCCNDRLRRAHGPESGPAHSRPSEKKESCPFSSATALTGQVHQRARPPLSP